MGIDIYMTPNGVYDNGDVTDGACNYTGDSGYLRESYHHWGAVESGWGAPAPWWTELLVPEAFAWVRNAPDNMTDAEREDFERGAPIPSIRMRKRAAMAKAALAYMYRTCYRDTTPDEVKAAQQQVTDFINLARRVEGATGEPPRIYASY